MISNRSLAGCILIIPLAFFSHACSGTPASGDGDITSYYILAAGCSGKPYGDGSDIRVINNVFVFSALFKGSRDSAWGDFEPVRGNYASGNIWEDTGEPAPPIPVDQ